LSCCGAQVEDARRPRGGAHGPGEGDPLLRRQAGREAQVPGRRGAGAARAGRRRPRRGCPNLPRVPAGV